MDKLVEECYYGTIMIIRMIYFWILSIIYIPYAFSHTAGHEHDQERELMLETLFALSWPTTTGLQSASILTATTPVSVLIWADGVALLVDASDLVKAGLNLHKRSPKGVIFSKEHEQIIVSYDDLNTLQEGFRYKDAIFADFFMRNMDKISYDRNLAKITLFIGDATATWSIKDLLLRTEQDHHDHEHDHDTEKHSHYEEGIEEFLLGRQFWSARDPLKANQKRGLGSHDSMGIHFQISVNAKPLIKAGLKPKQLHNVRYEVERYGFLRLLKRERLVWDFYL
ncbi:hypothetical protein PVA44_00580 [Entomospira nematocerorum]|uniref:Uncharacterized protein n=1 Tax=Entomospira nematocerorum TaxID=2719987 RepID=A0A968KUN1_9SPIO|nr:hypothetical protein [Entomospira nematocera]NIZ47464.1 hypothetical protein [Entomospira nematocera]WDI33996.1 hypothetical protein PVA44_00580 [Entomospira nematocera]